MIVEFRLGVPPGCIDWLWDNIGSGNVSPKTDDGNRHVDLVTHDWHAWKYERIAVPKTPEVFGDGPFSYVPTIEVRDDKDALLFALRWSGQ